VPTKKCLQGTWNITETAGKKKYRPKWINCLSERRIGKRTERCIARTVSEMTYAYVEPSMGMPQKLSGRKTYRIATKRYFDAYFALVTP